MIIRPRLKDILREVCLVSHLPASAMLSERRARAITSARRVYCYVARTHTEKSWPQIGRVIRKDHTSCMYLARTAQEHIEERRDSDCAVWVPLVERRLGVWRASQYDVDQRDHLGEGDLLRLIWGDAHPYALGVRT